MDSSTRPKTEVIFAECKTFNDFHKKDADRMVNLGDAFPGAILVFATLNESLSKQEKTILCRVVNRSRKHRKNGRPFNLVLILTGTELFSELHLSESWKEAGGIRAVFAQDNRPINLAELCDLTQQIYLDTDSWDQWLDKQFGRVTPPVLVHPTIREETL